jgi:hypothetical protein
MDWGFLRRFALISAVLAVVAVAAGQPLTRALLPAFKWELAWLDDTFRIDRLYLDRDGADQVVRVEVGLARPLTLNGQTFYPDPRGSASASTLVGNLTLPCVLLAAVALAWPVRSRHRRTVLTLRALALVPALLLLGLLNVPFILWAGLWGVVVHIADPNRLSPLLIWGDFLLGGGGCAAALALGACVGRIGARSLQTPSS